MKCDVISVSGVKGFLDESGMAHLHLEDIARGLAIVKREEKNGANYERVNKQALRAWLYGFGILNSEKDGLPDYVPENIFYKLCFKAGNKTALDFQAHVTDEIIPSIRKHGMYATPEALEKLLGDPDFAIRTFTAIKQEREERIRLEGKVAEDAPKVLFAESVEASDQSILVGELAKILRQNGVIIGQNRLFERLRQDGYLCSRGEAHNLPTQAAMDAGLFEIKKTTITNPDGTVLVSRTTKVTGKGQIYIIHKYHPGFIAG